MEYPETHPVTSRSDEVLYAAKEHDVDEIEVGVMPSEDYDERFVRGGPRENGPIAYGYVSYLYLGILGVVVAK